MDVSMLSSDAVRALTDSLGVRDAKSTSRVHLAALSYLRRQKRDEHPDGRYDGKRWRPSDAECQWCCAAVRAPSRAYTRSLMAHCRTVAHVANLYDVRKSDVALRVRTLRALARSEEGQAPSPTRRLSGGDGYYKVVARTESGRLVSVYDGATEYRLGHTLAQRVYRDHGGGYYVYESAEAARSADFPPTSILIGSPRVLLRVRAEGQYTVYPCQCEDCRYSPLAHHPRKLAFSRVTPVEIVEGVSS